MSVSGVSKFIFELYAADLTELRKYKASPEEVLSRYELSSEEKKAILAKDYATLYCLGVHPVLISHIVQIDEVANERNANEAYTKEYFSRIKECSNDYQDYYEKN
ncbi:MAG: hypothetical protein OK457_00980 [Thaumarchaeota archaeon]|nr:hypothetical protein [Nitrososphaerota archaeon]